MLPIEPSRVRAVVLDVGETILDETRIWEGWADWLGVPRLTFMGVLGGVIERGESHLRVFELLAPGFDLLREEAAREGAGVPNRVEKDDLYPDAIPTMERLRGAGFVVVVAGNQEAAAEARIASWELPADVVTSSASLGVEKPDPAFFRRLAEMIDLPPQACAYVGDRLDNDVLPAREAGMVSVFIRRGPWGHIQALRTAAALADIQIFSLSELPAALDRAG
jgi:FMN phosphatase YigB (HAD superfamily)